MPYQLIHGSAHSLPQIPDKSVHCLVTSPPYLGLRSYSGDQAIEWPTVEYSPMAGLAPIRVQGCEPGCSHEWADGPTASQQPQRDASGGVGGGRLHGTRGEQAGNAGRSFKTTQGAYCIHCGCWRGGLGLEPDISSYIGHLILCLREWHRILRPEGLCFVNLGDSYAANRGYQVTDNKHINVGNNHGSKVPSGLKPKDLMMVPARLALAAQADGWYLRSAIVWAKGLSFIPHYAGSCMPESVQDRPTQSYEMVYMLAKSSTYYYDAEAVKEQALQPMGVAEFTAQHKQIALRNGNGLNQSKLGTNQGNATRNLRNVWAINPQPFAGAHFACWPEALVTPMIKAGTSQHGCCAKCGSPWARVVEREPLPRNIYPSSTDRGVSEVGRARPQNGGMSNGSPRTQTTGWQRTCSCDCDEVVPATVLDPFAGSGTTLKAAARLGRSAIGVDISSQYLEELVPERVSGTQMEIQF